MKKIVKCFNFHLFLPLYPITSTPTTRLNQSNFQMNLAFLKQVLNFIIIFLDPPRLGCPPECAQEMWRVISWGECWKFFKVIVGGLDCLGLKTTFPVFMLDAVCQCPACGRTAALSAGPGAASVPPHPLPVPSLWVKLCFKQCPPLSKINHWHIQI